MTHCSSLASSILPTTTMHCLMLGGGRTCQLADACARHRISILLSMCGGCTAQLKADPDIRREGMELYSTLQLPYLKAILGSTVRVATLDGEADLRVPPGQPR